MVAYVAFARIVVLARLVRAFTIAFAGVWAFSVRIARIAVAVAVTAVGPCAKRRQTLALRCDQVEYSLDVGSAGVATTSGISKLSKLFSSY